MNRKEYMDADKLTAGEYDSRKGADVHAAYFAQFVDTATIRTLLNYISAEALLASRDYHLNDIPLAKWDGLPFTAHLATKAKEFGDNLSLSTKVCAYKQAARMWLAENGGPKIWPGRYSYAGWPSDERRWINGYAVGNNPDDALSNFRAVNRGAGEHELTGEPVA